MLPRRTISKILVILIVVPIAIRAWQKVRGLGDAASETEPIAAQIDEAGKNDVEGPAPDDPAAGGDDE